VPAFFAKKKSESEDSPLYTLCAFPRIWPFELLLASIVGGQRVAQAEVSPHDVKQFSLWQEYRPFPYTRATGK
jgi:hypothetical protein